MFSRWSPACDLGQRVNILACVRQIYLGKMCVKLGHCRIIFMTKAHICGCVYHPARSILKTLPATLPEVLGRAAVVIHYTTPAPPDGGLLTGFGNQLWVLFEGVGVRRGRTAALGPRLCPRLAEWPDRGLFGIMLWMLPLKASQRKKIFDLPSET